MSKGDYRASRTVTHRTYVAAECTACERPALRICILHDDCEFGTQRTPCKGHH